MPDINNVDTGHGLINVINLIASFEWLSADTKLHKQMSTKVDEG